jgi:glycosyltransferase involved in cell wall biosynthesis
VNAPLVSIVIASYNYGPYLGEAIESVLGQTHEPRQVVVVDDGSRDGSVDVARRYPIQVIVQPNQGVSAARNRGAAACSGEYIMFLDADDVLEADYVQKCLRALTAAPPHVAYAYTGMRYFGAEEKVWDSRPFDAGHLLRGNFVHASALIRHRVFQESGGFDTRWRLGHEDYELWIRLLKLGYEGVLVPEPLLRYRRHASSRNTLTKKQLRQLKWQMRIAHPNLYWWKLLKHPLASIYWTVRCRRALRGE